MIQIPVFNKRLCSEDHDFTLVYYLISHGHDEESTNTGSGYYGIGILKQDKNGQDEYESVNMISPDAKEVFDIISLLYDGSVTPITLKDVIRDYIKDKELSLDGQRPSA